MKSDRPIYLTLFFKKKKYFSYFWVFCLSIQILELACLDPQEIWDFDKSYIKPVYQFGENWHLYHVESSNLWTYESMNSLSVVGLSIYLDLHCFLSSEFYTSQYTSPIGVLFNLQFSFFFWVIVNSIVFLFMYSLLVYWNRLFFFKLICILWPYWTSLLVLGVLFRSGEGWL